MARHGRIDYAFLAKAGFLVGLAVFALGSGGELLGSVVFGSLPGWEQTLLFDLDVLGIVVALLAPLVFGVVLPLVE